MQKTLVLAGGLILIAMSCVPAVPPGSAGDVTATPLVGTRWELAELGGAASLRTPGQDQPYVRFLADGTLEGFSSCNGFSGRYEVSGAQLRSSGPMIMTKRACADQRLNEQEGRFTSVLNAMRRHAVAGNMLTLYAADGTILARLRA